MIERELNSYVVWSRMHDKPKRNTFTTDEAALRAGMLADRAYQRNEARLWKVGDPNWRDARKPRRERTTSHPSCGVIYNRFRKKKKI